MCSDELVLTLLEMVRLSKMKARVLLGAILTSMAPAEAQSNESKFYIGRGLLALRVIFCEALLKLARLLKDTQETC